MDKVIVKQRLDYVYNRLMNDPIKNTSFMNGPLFWVVNGKCFIRTVAIASRSELIPNFKKVVFA